MAPPPPPQRQRPSMLEQWRERDRPRQPAQVSLSREQIVRATLELIRRDGAGALSIRKLAAELGSGAASIYWHVQNKEELISLAFDEVLLELELPPPPASASWRDAVMELCWKIRSVLLVYADLFEAASGLASIGPGALRFTNYVLGIFRSSGFVEEKAVHAHNVLLDTVIGTAMLERSFTHVYEKGDVDVAELQRQYVEFFEALPSDTYPHLVALREHLVSGLNENVVKQRFESSMTVLLDGLEKLRDSTD